MKHHFFLLLLVLSVVLVACNDDDDTGPATPTEILTANTWLLTEFTLLDSAGTTLANIDSLFPEACERDDPFTFGTDGFYFITEAGALCAGDTAGQVDTAGTWALTNGDTQLNLTIQDDSGPTGTLSATVLEISNSVLRLSATNVDLNTLFGLTGAPTTNTLTTTYTAQ